MCGNAISWLEWLPPHRIKLSSSKSEKWGDFVWGAGFQLMVSDRFKQLYETEGLRGIELFYPPAEIVRVGAGKTGTLPLGLPTYRLVQIAWNGANLDDQLSGVIRKPGKVICHYHRGWIQSLEQIALDANSWDGSDIFIARGGLNSAIIVTERFRQTIEDNSLKNAWLVPAENYAYREIGGWYVRTTNEFDDASLDTQGKRQPPKPG
jgi:hypothetical protein